jgi:hypothetical protein
VLDRLDAHRVGVDVERAGGFAGRRADAAGEVGEVVGRVQDLDRLLPVAAETRSFQSGMMLFTGQPLLQKGCRSPCSAPLLGGLFVAQVTTNSL